MAELKLNMESSETITLVDKFKTLEAMPIEDLVGNSYSVVDMDIKNGHLSHQDTHLIFDSSEDYYKKSSREKDITGVQGPIENGNNNSYLNIEGLEVHCKGNIPVKNSKDNLHANEEDLGKRLDYYTKLTGSDCILPIKNLIKVPCLKANNSSENSGHFLNTLKGEVSNVDDNPALNSLTSVANIEDTKIMWKEEDNKSVLSENCEGQCAEDLLRRTSGYKPEVNVPLSRGCSQYDLDKRRRKKKRRNKKRKRKSRGKDIEGLQTEDQSAAQERRKMVVVVSVFAAVIFLTAVLLIVISLHMSQNLNSKTFSMGGDPENLTAGNGLHDGGDDHNFPGDVTSHLGSDTRNDIDNQTLTKHV